MDQLLYVSLRLFAIDSCHESSVAENKKFPLGKEEVVAACWKSASVISRNKTQSFLLRTNLCEPHLIEIHLLFYNICHHECKEMDE